MESAQKDKSWADLNSKYLGNIDVSIELHSPDLYRADYVYDVAAQGWEEIDSKLEQFVNAYNEQGCVIVRNAFNSTEVATLLDALNEIIDGKNESFNTALQDTKNDLKDNGDGGRWNSILQFESAVANDETLANLTDVDKVKNVDQQVLERRRDFVRKLHGFSKHDSRFETVLKNKHLLNFVKALLSDPQNPNSTNPEIQPDAFQDMVLVKPPGIGREKPWHQDNAFFNLSAGTKVVGTWISLDEAMIENGCMHIIPGQHKMKDGENQFWPHFQRRDWQICDADVMRRRRGEEGGEPVKVAAVCLKPGDMMIFTGLIPHGTPANQSTKRRRALQYHFITPNTPRVPTEIRLGLFGEEGKNVSC